MNENEYSIYLYLLVTMKAVLRDKPIPLYSSIHCSHQTSRKTLSQISSSVQYWQWMIIESRHSQENLFSRCGVYLSKKCNCRNSVSVKPKAIWLQVTFLRLSQNYIMRVPWIRFVQFIILCTCYYWYSLIYTAGLLHWKSVDVLSVIIQIKLCFYGTEMIHGQLWLHKMDFNKITANGGGKISSSWNISPRLHLKSGMLWKRICL